MDKKLVEFLKRYIGNIEETMYRIPTRDVIPIAFKSLINEGIVAPDELRKELSIYLERIISINEFEKLLRGEEQWISQD